MEIKGDIKLLECQPQRIQSGIVEVFPLCAAVDQSSNETQLVHASLQLRARGIDILQIQRRKASKTLGLQLY